jgi:hypothetical protein
MREVCVILGLEARLSALFKSGEEYEIVERFKGEDFKGKPLEQIRPFNCVESYVQCIFEVSPLFPPFCSQFPLKYINNSKN